jgi:hypothetical protein
MNGTRLWKLLKSAIFKNLKMRQNIVHEKQKSATTSFWTPPTWLANRSAEALAFS